MPRSGPRLITSLLLLTGVTFFAWSYIALADDSSGSDGLRHFRQEIQRLKSDEAAERSRVERDEKTIRDLENRLNEVEAQNRKLGSAAQALQIDNTNRMLRRPSNSRNFRTRSPWRIHLERSVRR
jgi:septal ring factor EnvC (AmiA/AmiB activator)